MFDEFSGWAQKLLSCHFVSVFFRITMNFLPFSVFTLGYTFKLNHRFLDVWERWSIGWRSAFCSWSFVLMFVDEFGSELRFGWWWVRWLIVSGWLLFVVYNRIIILQYLGSRARMPISVGFVSIFFWVFDVASFLGWAASFLILFFEIKSGSFCLRRFPQKPFDELGSRTQENTSGNMHGDVFWWAFGRTAWILWFWCLVNIRPICFERQFGKFGGGSALDPTLAERIVVFLGRVEGRQRLLRSGISLNVRGTASSYKFVGGVQVCVAGEGDSLFLHRHSCAHINGNKLNNKR